MATALAVLKFNLLFMPVWAWLLSVGLVAVSEIINRAKWTKAETLLQGSIRMIIAIPGVGVVLLKLPVLGLALQIVGKIDDAPPPPSPSDSSTRALIPLLFAASLLSACTLSQAVANSYRGLTVAEATVGAASVQFPTLSKAHELAIVAASTSEADGRKKIDAWRVTSDRIVKAIEGTDNSIKLARDAITEIRRGVRDRAQLGGWIATAIRLGIDLKDLLSAAGVPLGGI